MFVVVLILRRNENIFDSFIKLISVQWILVLILYEISSGFFIPLTSGFYVELMKFIFSTVFSYILFYSFFKRLKSKKIKPFLRSNILYFLAIILSCISVGSFIYYFCLFGNFYHFRQAVLNDNVSLYVGYSFPIVAASFFHAVLSEDKNRFLFAVLMVLLTIISSSKIFLILTLIFVSGIYRYGYKVSVKSMFIFFVSGFMLFSIMHILMDKIAGLNEYPLVVALGYTFLGYFLGGIAAFQMIVSNLFSTGVFYSSISGLVLNAPTKIFVGYDNGWVRTGHWYGNVYSGFAPWYEFSNQYGVVLYGVIIGLVHAIIYSHAKKSIALQFMKGFSIYSIIFIVFYDTYVMSIKLWIAFLIASIFLSLTIVNVKTKRKYAH